MITFPSVFRILWNANPITRKWILVIIDLLIVLTSITIVIGISSLRNYIFSLPIELNRVNLIWIYSFSLILSPIINLITSQYKALSRYSGVSSFYQILVSRI